MVKPGTSESQDAAQRGLGHERMGSKKAGVFESKKRACRKARVGEWSRCKTSSPQVRKLASTLVGSHTSEVREVSRRVRKEQMSERLPCRYHSGSKGNG